MIFRLTAPAGEGFTNSGDGLVMSPVLLGKYWKAGKEIASHAVLTPNGFRFSPAVTRGSEPGTDYQTADALSSIERWP